MRVHMCAIVCVRLVTTQNKHYLPNADTAHAPCFAFFHTYEQREVKVVGIEYVRLFMCSLHRSEEKNKDRAMTALFLSQATAQSHVEKVHAQQETVTTTKTAQRTKTVCSNKPVMYFSPGQRSSSSCLRMNKSRPSARIFVRALTCSFMRERLL